MDICVIGSGNVGGALGQGWVAAGHRVTFGVRDPQSEKVTALLATIQGQASADTVAQAAAAHSVIVLTTPWMATQDAIAACGDLTGKILIDCTNPIGPGFELTVGHTTSGGEQVATWATGAAVFKAFNTTGYNIMADPVLEERKAVMMVCGDDAEHKPTVIGLATDLGFEAMDAGPLSMARYLEPYAMLWIKLAMVYGQGRNFAFSVIRR